MKDFVEEVVGAINEMPVIGIILGFLMILIVALTVGIPLSTFNESLASLYLVLVLLIWIGYTLLAGLSFVLPMYLHYVSEGAVDWNPDFKLCGESINLTGLILTLGFFSMIFFWLVPFIILIVVSLPLWVTVSFVGLALTGVALHYLLKFSFKLSNKLNRHVNDPDAHKKS